MRFQVTHKLTTYLLVLAAMGTLASANLLTSTAALAAIGLGGLSWFFDPGTRVAALMDRATPVARLVATAFFALSAYQVWSRLPEPDLTPVLNLVLFLIVYKLFQRSANRDYLQIYVLAFLMVMAGAAFAQSFLFAAAFTAYVVLTTWTLILLHLRREMEENYLVKHSGHAPSHKVGVARILNSRRVVGGPFLTATGAVALAVCLGAVLTFALVPRVGAGFAFGGTRTRKSLIGFSDEVTLGTSGFLSSDDETVALRATVPRLLRLASDRDREAELDHFYWRGTVYDTYSQGRWLRSRRETLRSQITEADGPMLVSEPHMRPVGDATPSLAGTDRQEIDIVGVSAPVAFALDRPVAFEIPPPKFGTLPDLRLVPRWSGEVAFQTISADGPPSDVPGEQRMLTGAHYTAYSRDPFVMTLAVNGRPLAQIPREIIAPYLTLSPTLSPRVIALARQDHRQADRPPRRRFWLSSIGWSAPTNTVPILIGEQDRPTRSKTFCSSRRPGHCEYFASAAAMLLREVGVPTRYVNGFLGGEWNAVGQYVTVRQNRAHAWVEAYLGESGWMRVDATPPVRAPGRMGKLRQLQDSMEFFWSRWVVGYDLGRQLDLARNFGRNVGVTPAPTAKNDPGGLPWKRLGAFALGAIGIVIALVMLRRRRRANAPGAATSALGHQAIGRLYRRCLERLAERGTPRRPSETPREFADRIVSMGLDGATAFQRLSELYLAARFGRKEIKDHTVADLGKQLGRLGLPAQPVGMPRAA